MNMSRGNFRLEIGVRFLALFLALCLSLPSNALALRPTEPEEQGNTKEKLVSALQGTTSIPVLAAGMEEVEARTPRQDLMWEYLTSSPGMEVTFEERDPVTNEIRRYTLPALGLPKDAVRKNVQLLWQNPRTIASKWAYLTEEAGALVELMEVDEATGKKEAYRLPALGLPKDAVRKNVQLLWQNPRTIASKWAYLTEEAGALVELMEVDEATGKKEAYHLPALGLPKDAVRKCVQLLTRNPRTIASHWAYLTGHWPRLADILRRAPLYLTYSLWDRYVLRASYLKVLSYRWNELHPNVELPQFMDLNRVHIPLTGSDGNFSNRLRKVGGLKIKVDDWGNFRSGWPILVAIQRRVQQEGVNWDQDWPNVLLADPGLPEDARRLLTEPEFARLREALFREDGRLRDLSYQIPFPLPEDAAGPEEAKLTLLTKAEAERAKNKREQDSSLDENLKEIGKRYREEFIDFLYDEYRLTHIPAIKEIADLTANLVEGDDGILALLALLGDERVKEYQKGLEGHVDELLDLTPRQIKEALEKERLSLFEELFPRLQEMFPGKVPGVDYNFPRFGDTTARKLYWSYLRQMGDGYQSMGWDEFNSGLDRLEEFIQGDKGPDFVKAVIAYDPDYHYRQIKTLWERRHGGTYLSYDEFKQLVEGLDKTSLSEHPELLSALFATYDYPSFQITIFKTAISGDLERSIREFVEKEGKRLSDALAWAKSQLTEEGDEDRAERQRKVLAYLKIREEGYGGLITGKQIRQYRERNKGLFLGQSPVEAIAGTNASDREKHEALFVVTLYGIQERMKKVKGRPDGKQRAEELLKEVLNAILAYALTDQDLAWKFGEGADPLVGLTAVDQAAGDSYRDLQKASRIIEPGTNPADLNLTKEEVSPIIPKDAKKVLKQIRDQAKVLLVQAGKLVSDRRGVVTFEPMGFEKGYRGYIGEDCTTCRDNQAFAALHPSNRYYAIRMEGKVYGYIGLTEATLADKRVLVVDTIQSPASKIPTQHIPEILARLEEIARDRGFIGIVLPVELEATFNHAQVRNAIKNHPKYREAGSPSGIGEVPVFPVAQKAMDLLTSEFGITSPSESLEMRYFYLWSPFDPSLNEWWARLKRNTTPDFIIQTPKYWIGRIYYDPEYSSEMVYVVNRYLGDLLDRLVKWSGLERKTELSIEQKQAVTKVFGKVVRYFFPENRLRDEWENVTEEGYAELKNAILDLSEQHLPDIISNFPPKEVIPKFLSLVFSDKHEYYYREMAAYWPSITEYVKLMHRNNVRTLPPLTSAMKDQLERAFAPGVLNLWRDWEVNLRWEKDLVRRLQRERKDYNLVDKGDTRPWQQIVDVIEKAYLGKPETPAAGLEELLKYVKQPVVIDTIALLAESGKTGDITNDFPALKGLANKAGFQEGVVSILRSVGTTEAVLNVPAEYMEGGIPVYVQAEWEDRVRENLKELEMAGRIRFVGSIADAFWVIGDHSISVQPHQVLIAVNEGTVSQVTPHLLKELQENGLLKAGSVVMLYTPLKDSVLVFA